MSEPLDPRNADALPPPVPPRQYVRSAITIRSVLLGLLGVIFIAALTPYNDYALNNTFFIGFYLPTGLVMILFLFTLLINGPLSRFAPRWAFSSGEVTVAFIMMLVGCAIPASGLMRYFPPTLVTPWHYSVGNPTLRGIMTEMNLPDWIWPDFPDYAADPEDRGQVDVADRVGHPVVSGYMGRWTMDDEPIPYRAWVRPGLFWAIFFFSLYGALVCLVSIVRRQWFENEKLPFPLAQVQLALVEQPRAGTFLNTIFRSPAFWIALLGVVAVHSWNSLGLYYPEYIETIPLKYDFRTLMADPPWSHISVHIKSATIFFTVLGVTYFLSTPVAFSLWFFFVAWSVYYMFVITLGGQHPHHEATWNQHFGAVLAFVVAIIWVGRNHWMLVLRQAFRGAAPGEPQGRYMSYFSAFWGLVACFISMFIWLLLAGMSWPGALLVLALLLTLFMVITRIIAETGMVYGQLLVPLWRPWQMIAMTEWFQKYIWAGAAKPVSTETFFLSTTLQQHFYDFREPLPVYATHGMKVADQTIYDERSDSTDQRRQRRIGRGIILLMFVALAVSYAVSYSSTLYTQYNYSETQDKLQQSPINPWGTAGAPHLYSIFPLQAYHAESHPSTHNPWGHVGGGFLFSGVLAFMRLYFVWWPFHPVGFIMMHTTPVSLMWFSIFLGWICKILIVKFGGASLYKNAKSFFLGLIVGEAVAAGLWLTVGLVMAYLDIPYHHVNFLPA